MIHLQLVTLTGIKYDNDVYEVVLPTLDGQIGVLTDHMPLLSVATTGVISIRKQASDSDQAMDHYATDGGVIEVFNNNLKVLVDEADHSDEINETEAKKAYELAEKMKSEAKDQVSIEKAQNLIDRSSVRLQVAGLRRRTHK